MKAAEVFSALFLIATIKPSESANIIVIDINHYKDTLHDDYGPVNGDYDYFIKEKPTKRKQKFETLASILKKDDKDTEFKGSLCTRLFRSMYGKPKMNCINSLIEKRDMRHFDAEPGNMLTNFYEKLREKAHHFTGFSQDYLDVSDLGRSKKDNVDFAEDYFDIFDFSRSNNDSNCDDNRGKKCKVKNERRSRVKHRRPRSILKSSTSSDSSDSSDENSLRMGNRFQVVYNDLGDDDKRGKNDSDIDNNDKKNDYESDSDLEINNIQYFNDNSKNYNDVEEKYSKSKKRQKYDDRDRDEVYVSNGRYNLNGKSDESGKDIKKSKYNNNYDNDIVDNFSKDDDIISNENLNVDSGRNQDIDSKENQDDIDINQYQDEKQNIPNDGDFGFSELSDEVTKKRNTKKRKHSKEDDSNYYVYLQGNKLYNVKDDEYRRQRLPYFLPKRIWWKLEDIPKLGSYWFHGPR